MTDTVDSSYTCPHCGAYVAVCSYDMRALRSGQTELCSCPDCGTDSEVRIVDARIHADIAE